jgi:hypothetical protein
VARNVSVRTYPFAPWDRLKALISWKQGQHVFCCGGTNSGKSTVAAQFLPRRARVVVCVSKGKDPIFEQSPYKDYPILTTWRPRPKDTHVLLWPKNADSIPATRANKKIVFSEMFDNILLVRGHWCIDVDEEHYMADSLGLDREIVDILEQGRSAGISMWNNSQRPSSIPLATYVNSAHFFLFQTQEEYDARRLGRIGNKHTNADEMIYNLDRLESFETHEFVYVDRTGRIPPVRSIVTKGRKKTSADH